MFFNTPIMSLSLEKINRVFLILQAFINDVGVRRLIDVANGAAIQSDYGAVEKYVLYK